MKEKVVYIRRSRLYGSVKVRRDGRVRFSTWSFEDRSHINVRVSSPHGMDVCVSGRQVLLMFLNRGRVVSACFVYTLTADELYFAVNELRMVTGGLEGWIIPALEWTQMDLGRSKDRTPERRALVDSIPDLLDACGYLPVSPVWQRHRRETQQAWVKHLRTHPEEISRITAPWMLPEGYKLPTLPRRRRSRSRAS